MAYQYGSMRIVGGTDALHGSWPWIVSIQNPRFSGTGHMCGGSLISSQWVLSAAHCFGHPSYVLESRVVIGANDLTQLGYGVEVRSIRRAILHEHYNNKTMANDIALLELDGPVWCSNYIQLACVPDTWLHVAELTECYVSGWGVTRARCKIRRNTEDCKMLKIFTVRDTAGQRSNSFLSFSLKRYRCNS
ncbi:UNVERIFIED_CONTAM: hypothetical protein H355_006231 [Colinus virginianus]|nr:hypothetical protein H355_006231 [Colinus virginianus]